MQQPANKSSDERFWRCFASHSERVADCAGETDLPTAWWIWPLSQRAEELLTHVPNSDSSAVLDRRTIKKITIRGLTVCEQKPDDFAVAVRSRIAVMRKLVEQKGKDYNAGGVGILEYWPQGVVNIIHEIRKRALRLLSLGRSGQQPEFDETAEIGLDIAAYSLFLLAYMDVATVPN